MAPRCPHAAPVVIGGRTFTPRNIIEILTPLVSTARRRRIERVVTHRTCTVTPVLEGIADRGNANAVLRSAEGLGFQTAHVVESTGIFKKANRVTQGAEKWLDVTRWPSSEECIAGLHAQGYRIAVSCFHGASPIDSIDFTRPTALVFGNEKDGVTEGFVTAADYRVVVPMLGFSRSFNVSVAAALCLYHVVLDRIRRLGRHGDLTPEEREGLQAEFYRRSVEHADRILEEAVHLD